MDRIPEPELMLDEAQARAYASADFAEPHDRCVDLLRAKLRELPPSGRALDLGCGPGDMTLRLARALPGWSIDAVDGSPAMLDLAHGAAAEAGIESRVRFHRAVLPRDPLPGRDYQLVFSNSLLHHLADPMDLWSAVRRAGMPGAFVFVMDLLRPARESEARALVERYASGEPEVLRTDFYNSLRAAYRPGEVERQLSAAALDSFAVEVVSDRHLVASGRLGAAPP
jgi:SAM-dependent methyltransferase